MRGTPEKLLEGLNKKLLFLYLFHDSRQRWSLFQTIGTEERKFWMFLLLLNFTKQVGKATADLEIVRICCDPNKGDARDHLDGSAKTALTHNGPLSLLASSLLSNLSVLGSFFNQNFPFARRFADKSFSPQIDRKPQRKDLMDATRSLQ